MSETKKMIQISVAYATSSEQVWRDLTVPEGTTVLEAIETSGILNEFPEIDLTRNKVGVYGHITEFQTPAKEGDRVEIYRPIRIDPEKLERKKYKLRKVEPIIERLGSVTKLTGE